MPKQSAGILAYKRINKELRFFLCHPGGPFYKNKDGGVWTIPKGEFEPNEDAFAAALREFTEETGQTINGDFISLPPVKYKNGKTIHAWAVEADIDETNIVSNTFPLEWPPKSGKYINVPEIDEAGWFTYEAANQKIIPALAPLISELINKLK
jgi:predicted NUDIX family NTP pyrophosphohydrolase